jgi:nitrogen fixation/metabolism regulation signal transduction histidine kinase
VTLSPKRRLSAYVIALHLLLFLCVAVLMLDRPLLFVGMEVCLAVSLAGGLWLFGRALEPLAYTQRFHDLLNEQSYGARLQLSGSPELDKLLTTFNGMLQALHAERLRIGEQQGFLERLLEATPSAVVVFDFDGGISLQNASAHSLLGFGGCEGRSLAALAARHPLAAQLDAVPPGEARLFTTGDGRRLRVQHSQFYDRGFARRFLMVEELTAELEESERATYEKLIRVLAHEVNNTVAATGSVFDSLLYYSAQLRDEDRTDFTTAVNAVKRRNTSLAEFIERFTRVVKMPAPELLPVAVHELVEDAMRLYREPCRARGITIEWARSDELPPVRLDRQLMEQALLNIVKNAMEAVGENGTIRLALEREGRFARLRVTDSGRALAGADSLRLFQPFYTTKKSGQGIGLLFVREVLTRHGFTYRLAPDANGDTCFEIGLLL